MPDLRAQYATHHGERAHGDEIAAIARSGQIDAALDRLHAEIAAVGGPLADLCMTTRHEPVRLTDWDALSAAIFKPLRSGALCTAVGIDLSVHSDGDEPAVEVSYYDDGSFPFSTSKREDILAKNAAYGVPWQGNFSEIESDVFVTGLAPLFKALKSPPPPVARGGAGQAQALAPAGYVAYQLMDWIHALRFHKAVKSTLDTEGLARRLPVIVGSHDLGPFLETVHFPAASRESAADAVRRMEAAGEARRTAWRAEKLRRVNEEMESLREMRKLLRAHRWWPSKQIRTLRGYYEAKERMHYSIINRPAPTRSNWRIADDTLFEERLQQDYLEPAVT